MSRVLVLFFLMCVPLAWAQVSDDSDETAPEASEPAEDAEAGTDDDLDDIGDLDEPYPLEDDDVFIPSEDVAFGQSIPFPTDI